MAKVVEIKFGNSIDGQPHAYVNEQPHLAIQALGITDFLVPTLCPNGLSGNLYLPDSDIWAAYFDTSVPLFDVDLAVIDSTLATQFERGKIIQIILPE